MKHLLDNINLMQKNERIFVQEFERMRFIIIEHYFA